MKQPAARENTASLCLAGDFKTKGTEIDKINEIKFMRWS